MRITALDIVGFRAFASRQHLDLDGDTVIVVGANGQGKTSLFDSILWGLTGQIPRLRSDKSLLSLFSDAGECRVSVGLRSAEGAVCEVVRSSDGSRVRRSFTIDGQSSQGPAATTALLEQLWPDALAAADPSEAFVSAMETGVYLQQDLVRQFIDVATDQDRFRTIGELVGTGRITELQTQLESSRNAWSRVSKRRATEKDELVQRRARIREQLERLRSSQSAGTFDIDSWGHWWAQAGALGLSAADVPDPGAASAAARLDVAVRELQAIEQADGRRRQELFGLREGLAQLPPAPQEDLAASQANVERLRAELERARTDLERAQEHAAELRRLQVQAAEARAELRALADLALRHLGDRCPVCSQEYDRDTTRRRLEATLHGETPPAQEQTALDIDTLAATVQQHEQAVRTAVRGLDEARERRQAWEAQMKELQDRADRLSLRGEAPERWQDELSGLLEQQEARLARFRALREQADQLAVALARVGEHARGSELEHELTELDQQVSEAELEVRRRDATYDMLTQIIDGLRAASSDLIEDRLDSMEPLLQRIYASADPHPAFRVARLLSRMKGGRGRVVPEITDPIHGASSETPDTVLSSSQMNVLAVSVFLALNLGMPSLPLGTLILDDPLQSLDDMNLLGLVDLLRRTRERRQVFISTHDHRLAGLLERKLRPVRDDQRTIVVELEGWNRDGPVLAQRDLARDEAPVRIAA